MISDIERQKLNGQVRHLVNLLMGALWLIVAVSLGLVVLGMVIGLISAATR